MANELRFVGPFERIIYLRSLPNIGQLPDGDLAEFALRAQERFIPRGTVLIAAGSMVDRIRMLVEGHVEVYRDGKPAFGFGAPEQVGFLEVLSRRPSAVEIRTVDDCVALEVTSADYDELLEEHFSVFSKTLEILCLRMMALQDMLETRGVAIRTPVEDVPYPEKPLDFIARLQLIRKAVVFAEANVDALAELARANVEERYEPGDVLFREGDPANAAYNIVSGTVRCETATRSFVMGPRSIVGNLDQMARRPRAYTATALTRLVVLRTERDRMLDVLEDHVEIGIELTSFLARATLRLIDIRDGVGITPAASMPKAVRA